MLTRGRIIVLCCLLSLPFVANGQASQKIRPQWLKSYQSLVRDEAPYRLILVETDGASLTNLKNSRMNDLASYLKSSNQIEGEIDWNASSSMTDSDYLSSSTHSLSFKTKTTVETFNCKLIDDYWERIGGGYKYYSLFAYTEPGTTAEIDNFSLTTSYATDPAIWGLSLIPGAAQMHKGSYFKGGIIMGGSVVLAGGLIAFESFRSSYVAKISQTHSADVKKAYNTKAGNCATFRNICIGGLAALYIYNIVDAYIAPGARRVIVSPAATPQGQYGMAVSYTF